MSSYYWYIILVADDVGIGKTVEAATTSYALLISIPVFRRLHRAAYILQILVALIFIVAFPTEIPPESGIQLFDRKDYITCLIESQQLSWIRLYH
jgi:hypothetical protein